MAVIILAIKLIFKRFFKSLSPYLIIKIYNIENDSIRVIIPVLIFIFKITDILNDKIKEIILNIIRAKYNPLLSKKLYRQKIVSSVNIIINVVIISPM